MTGADESQRASLVRKLMHIAVAIAPAIGWLFSYPLALGLAGIAFLASLVLEAARRWWPWVNRFLWRMLPTIFRRWEHRRVLGSTWFSLGMLASFLLFGRDAGGLAILFLAWGDPAAEVVGRRWGRQGEGKTWIGSMACLVACLMACLVGVSLGGLSLWAALAGAVVATSTERWSPPPDDNLWMPVLSGLTMVAVQWLVNGTYR